MRGLHARPDGLGAVRFFMNNGIAIYPGLDNTPKENERLLETAAKCGIRRVFTSLHIPETDKSRLQAEVRSLLARARQYGMEVISDVSPATRDILGIDENDAAAFASLGITRLRLDYGYTAEETARLSHRSDIQLQLNASTVTEEELQNLRDAGTDFSHLDALHNFYPRRGTGLSTGFFREKTALLHRYGIAVGAFIPSHRGRRRSPLADGLPTLEDHRDCPSDRSARALAALDVNSVFLADSLPTDDEIAALGQLREHELTLHATLLSRNPDVRKLLSHTFTTRADEARDAWRAQESRPLVKQFGIVIHPENTDAPYLGAVTLDNKNYGRYMGELQIARYDLPADARTNVVAQIAATDLGLLEFLRPGEKFSFQFPKEPDIIE